jgi:hypothetical protein
MLIRSIGGFEGGNPGSGKSRATLKTVEGRGSGRRCNRGFRVVDDAIEGLGFRVWGLGFRVGGLGCGV